MELAAPPLGAEWGFVFLWELSFSKWASESIVSNEALPVRHLYNLTTFNEFFGYQFDAYGFNMGMLVLNGTVLRLIAFLLMIATHMDKQK